MNRFLLVAAAALCALTVMPTLPAAAMPVSPLAPVAAQAGVDTVLVHGGHGHGWGAEVGVTITVGAEATGVTMDGHVAGIAAGAKSNLAICSGRRGGDHASGQ